MNSVGHILLYDLDLKVSFSALFDEIVKWNKSDTAFPRHKVDLDLDTDTGQITIQDECTDEIWTAMAMPDNLVHFERPAKGLVEVSFLHGASVSLPILEILLKLAQTSGGSLVGFYVTNQVVPFCVIRGVVKEVSIALLETGSLTPYLPKYSSETGSHTN